MADGVIQLVSSLGSVTTMPEDVIQNSVSVALVDGTYSPAHVTTMMQAFRDFYLVQAAGASDDLGGYLGTQVSRAANACSVAAYDTADLTGGTPLGSPIASLNFTMSAAVGAIPYPDEVAVVCSVHADLTDVPVTEPNPTPPPAIIRPQQRRRGRLYLGPLQSSAGTTASNVVRPSSAIRTDLGLAMKALALAIAAIDPNYYLGVWSKSDAEVWEITGGWVDNAFDTQRRRGLASTARTTFTV